MRMSKTNLSLACAAGTLALTLGAASSAQAEGQVADVMLGSVGPGERSGRARQGFHQGHRHRDEARVRPWTSYADRFINLLNSRSKPNAT